MKRRLLNLLTLLSLMLCVAVVALWVRSYRGKPLHFERSVSQNRRLGILNQDGGIGFLSRVSPRLDTSNWGQQYRQDYYVFRRFGMLMSEWDPSTGVLGTSYVEVVEIRHWSVAVASAILPAAWVVRALRRTPRRGLCPRCCYDLRATPDRCPECGHVPASSATASAGGR